MDTQQVVIAEIEAFLDFHIKHTERHRLKSFLITVDKASNLLSKIRTLKVDPSMPPPVPVNKHHQSIPAVPQSAEPVWDQSRYNAWFIEEIQRLQGQITILEQKLA